jgi:mRNA interferase RelE/StbE
LLFEVFLGREAEKALKSIDRKISLKVKEALLHLKITPLPFKDYDLKKIAGSDNIYRIRISSFRIIYSVQWESKTINVLRIARRDDKTYRGI